jgi:hypothetical protein
MTETTELRWFEVTERPCSRCSKRAVGILRGAGNESFGPHCQKCADKRLKDSAKAREAARERATHLPDELHSNSEG